MPRALIVADWDKIAGPVIKAIYPEIEIDPTILLKVFMTHTAQEPIEVQLSLQIGSANIASRFTQYEHQGVMRRHLFILLLNPEEKANDFFSILKDFEQELKFELDASYLPELVKNLYIKKTKTRVTTQFNVLELSNKIIDRSKQLLDQGEIQKAQNLISKAKTIPPNIAQTLELADKALIENKYVIAGNYYEAASKLVFEVDETALMQQYHEKAEKLKKIPILLKERKEYVENAAKALKKVDFSEAIEWFKAAAKKSNELEDETKSAEYAKKAKALTDFLEAEREAKLKESSEESN
ncbi:MAG: hypothetical protein ACTSQI_14745 [Candidatus Helarchaeota archaeon]